MIHSHKPLWYHRGPCFEFALNCGDYEVQKNNVATDHGPQPQAFVVSSRSVLRIRSQLL